MVSHLRDIHLTEAGHESLRGQAPSQHLTPYMGTRYEAQTSIPKFKIPDDGAPSDTVYYMIKDELDLDGRPNLNLAR